jgi:demethylmenaquinone methyltransferase/2-methoxy-6-polyprenyl-1,4-benzoquinol methylase
MEDPEKVRTLFGAIATRYDLANHLLSGGLDLLWRRRAARIVRRWAPRTLLDLATGSGDLALAIARACPDATVTGVDFCEPMLERARAKGLRNTVVADAMALPFASGTFDVVTVAFGLRNMAAWDGALREMARVLRVGGHLLVLDFSVPPPPLRYAYRFYLHHCLPRIAAVLTGKKAAYEYLGASIEAFPHGRRMQDLIEANGFAFATWEPLTGGIVALYTGVRRAD